MLEINNNKAGDTMFNRQALAIGDHVIARGITATFQIVGFRTIESFEPIVGADLRRVHPVTGELEGGEAFWLALEGSGMLKLSSLASMI